MDDPRSFYISPPRAEQRLLTHRDASLSVESETPVDRAGDPSSFSPPWSHVLQHVAILAVLVIMVVLAWPSAPKNTEPTDRIVIVKAGEDTRTQVDPLSAVPVPPANMTATGNQTISPTLVRTDAGEAVIKLGNGAEQRFAIGAEVHDGFYLAFVGDTLAVLETVDGRRLRLTARSARPETRDEGPSLNTSDIANSPQEDDAP